MQVQVQATPWAEGAVEGLSLHSHGWCQMSGFWEKAELLPGKWGSEARWSMAGGVEGVRACGPLPFGSGEAAKVSRKCGELPWHRHRPPLNHAQRAATKSRSLSLPSMLIIDSVPPLFSHKATPHRALAAIHQVLRYPLSLLILSVPRANLGASFNLAS